MNFILMRILKNIGLALIAKPMVFFGLRIVSKSTTNLVDDNVVNVVEAAYDGDMDKLEVSLKASLSEVQKLIEANRKK